MSETNGKTNELELVWMNPRETKPNPMNWRKHPPQQTQVVESLIFGDEKVGWAGAALFNKTTGNLIDGHDRRGLAIKHNAMMPVLVGSWTEAQEKLILATLDPTTNMAVTDAEMLDTLMRDIHVMDKNITQMLADMAEKENLTPLNGDFAEDQSVQLRSQFQILIECNDEIEQTNLLNRFSADGLNCRALIS